MNYVLPAGATDAVGEYYPGALRARLPAVTPDGDHGPAFAALAAEIGLAETVGFADMQPSALDGFFRLRLAQVADGLGPLDALAVIELVPDPDGAHLAGGFADRFQSGWPFARCIFAADPADAPALSARLGLPVWPWGDGEPKVLRTGAAAGQPVAVVLQPVWGRSGSTTAYENQAEGLVRSGRFTLRLFCDPSKRRGATLSALMERAVPENSANAGAHVELLAVPDGPPPVNRATTAEQAWAAYFVLAAECRVGDGAAARVIGRASLAIANHIDAIGAALRLAPSAALLLDVHEDRAAAIRSGLERAGRDAASIDAHVAAAARAQALLLAVPELCTFAAADSLAALGPLSRAATVVLPRVYARAVPDGAKRFDVLAVADDNPENIASLRWFLNAVWRPYLEPQGVRVAVVGKAGLQLDAAERASGLSHFLGFIPDLDTFRSFCRLTVVPDRAAAGVSVKMLATLAAGHPVVTTSMGLRGLDPAVAALLPARDDPAAFAADVRGLLRDPGLLAERHALVGRVQDAIRRGPSHADLALGLPAPGAADIVRRTGLWAQVVAGAPLREASSFRFVPGQAFPLSGTFADEQVLVGGWQEGEAWGRWTDGAEASLRIALAGPARDLLALELDIVAHPACGRLTVLMDGVALAAAAVPSDGANLWDIPAACLRGKDSVLVTLLTEGTHCPAAEEGSVDGRVLGLGVRSVRVVSRQPTLCEPGAFLAVNRGAAPKGVLLSGWHGLEDWGCWSNGPSASLRLSLEAAIAGPVRLELDLAPTPVGASLVLSANGWQAEAVAPRNGINAWDLPAHVTDGATEVTLGLAVGSTFCPAAVGGSNDDRVLGIGLRRARLRRFDPVVAAVGARLRLGAPAELDEVLSEGWHRPEHWGCWTSGAAAELRLRLDRAVDGPGRLELLLSLPPVVPELTVTVNGHALEPVVPVAGANSFPLPDGVLDGSRAVVIGLRVSGTFCPAAAGSSGDDRVLGIGVAAVALHRVARAVCRVGQVVPLSVSDDGTDLLLRGWHVRENWGCWTAGAEAVLRLRLDGALSGPHVLRLDLFPPLAGAVIGLSVNGSPVQETEVREGPNDWAMPLEATEGAAVLEVRFHVGRPERPSAVGGAGDDRLLGGGVRAVTVVPA